MGEQADCGAEVNAPVAVPDKPSAEATAPLPVPDKPSPRNPAGRLGPRWYNWPKALLGLPHQRRLARASLAIDAVRHWAQEFGRLSDDELKQQSNRLRG